MSKTVVGSFDTFEHARAVVDALEAQGVAHADLNVVANDAAGRHSGAGSASAPSAGGVASVGAGGAPPRVRDPAEGGDVGDGDAAAAAGRGALAGGVIGGTAGLIAGLAGLALPGVGPLVAAGPIAAALTGAGIGAIAGGLINGLRQLGVSDTDAEYYAEAVRRGGALVVVRADDDRAQAVADAMRLHGAIDIESRVASWRASGWTGFDPGAEPYSVDRIERERSAYRTGGGVPEAVQRNPDADLRSGTMTGRPFIGTAAAAAGAMSGGATIGGVPLAGGVAAGEGVPGLVAPLPVGTGTGAVPGAGTGAGSGAGTGASSGAGTGTGSGTVSGTGTGTGVGGGGSRGSDHPNLGHGSERPGVDTRSRDHARRAGMDAGDDAAAPKARADDPAARPAGGRDASDDAGGR